MYAARPLYAYASAGLTLLIALMLGVNLTLFTHELHRRWMLRHSITATGGVIAGIIGAACPVCAVGLFPIFSGFFGSLFSLSTLPLYGLEFSILSVVLLGISLWTLTGIDLTCPLPPHGKKR